MKLIDQYMQVSLRSLFFAILALISLLARSQQPAFRNYSVDNGLPSSEVFHIIQDKKGYIWMATNMGVSRFDGREFRNFDVQDGLPENTVFEIFEDELERLWFISFPFQLSYFMNDSIHHYKYNDTLETLAGHGLIPIKKSFHADKDDNIIFSFLNDGQIYELDKSGHLKIIRKIDESTSVMVIEYNGRLFGAQNESPNISGEYILLLETDIHKKKYIPLEKPDGRFAYGNFMMEQLKSGDLLFAHNEILTTINNKGYKQSYKIDDRVLWLSAENDSTIWIGKESTGIGRYSTDDIVNGAQEHYLDGVAITSVLIDNEGGKWFSSIGSGVFYLTSKAFISYTKMDGLSGKNVLSVEMFKDKLYIGSDNHVLDVIEKGKIKHAKSFFSDNVKSINVLISSEQQLFISAKTIMYSFDGADYTEYENNHSSILNSVSRKKTFSIKDIFPLGPGEVMLAQMRSISFIKNHKVIYDSYMDGNMALRIESIGQESDSTFLLGTFSGLYRFTNNRFIYLGHEHDLLKNRITQVNILKNKEGTFLGTKGSGLIVNYSDTIFQIKSTDGLSSNSITSILITGNDLWVATNNGLNLLKLNEIRSDNRKIVVFNKENGLISNEINQIKGDSNFIYIATNGGLTIFDRKEHHSFINPPPIYIHGVSIMNQSAQMDLVYDLKYNQNFIRFSYTGISFRDAGNLVYKYKLNGLSSNQWVYTKNVEVEYAFLPPGKYKFEVYAINSEGLISSNPAIVNFVIHPPFWKTWWFKSLIAIILIILTIVAVAARMRQVKKQHAMQSDIIKYRQQSLLRQMDPHFVFNTLNSIQSFIIKNESKASTIYLAKFSRLLRLILNNSQQQSVKLSNEIDSLDLYMDIESMRFKEKFNYSITHDSTIIPDMCFIPAFIVQPFIENSIWHGIMPLEKAGNIMVHFEKNGEQVICSIEDNGVGRKKAAENKASKGKSYTSLGISIVETRLSLLSEYYGVKMNVKFIDLYSEDNEPTGTRVIINLPIVN